MPTAPKTLLKIFVLTKNEENNIQKCLSALEPFGQSVTVLDSGSTDRTIELAEQYGFATVVRYQYVDHCLSYNDICTHRAEGARYLMILDADMVVSQTLFSEVLSVLQQNKADVCKAPVLMCAEAHPVSHGSLCPPKAFIFRAGREYFTPMGHGEALGKDCVVYETRATLLHDDRKNYAEYLRNQYRYAQNLFVRSKTDDLAFRDKVRVYTPLMILLTPLVSYVLKGGFLAGSAAVVYALDRLIAEAVMFRQAVAGRLHEPERTPEPRKERGTWLLSE